MTTHPISLSIKEYLKKYQSGADDSKKANKKKKKPKHQSAAAAGVLIVDEDPVWQKSIHLEDAREEDASAGEETPQILNNSGNSDLSPPRRTSKESCNYLSPPSRAQKQSLELTEERNSSAPNLSPARRKVPALSKDARRGGLLSAKEMREEIDKKKEERSWFASMDPSLIGRGAEAVHRDKEGRRISKEDLRKSKETNKEEKPLEWGKGLTQKRDAKEMMKELELETGRPFARSRDDPELDKMLKDMIRWGDPMAHVVKQRKTLEAIIEDLGQDEKMKESGFMIPQTIPSHSWLKKKLGFHPNRYSIRPGRHWDGINRSSGYEMQLFKIQNEKRAIESKAYLWSVSDM